MIFAGSNTFVYDNKLYDSNTLLLDPKVSFGWFLLRFLVSLTIFEKFNLEKSLGISFNITNEIQTGWYIVYLNQTQYIHAKKLSNIQLFNIPRDKITQRLISSDNEYIVQTTQDWFTIRSNSSKIFQIHNNVFVVQNMSLEELMDDPMVLRVENSPRKILQNRFIGGLLQDGATNMDVQDGQVIAHRELQSRGINGNGRIITAMDTGIDMTHCFFRDTHFGLTTVINKVNLNHRKVVRLDAVSDFSDAEAGHGTHVAGIIAGESIEPKAGIAAYNGIAPKSRLYIVDMGLKKSTTDLSGNPNLDNVFANMKDINSRIQSNSWTYEEPNLAVTKIYDQLTYTNQEILPVFANGNLAGRNNAFSPLDCKNLLSVGWLTRPVVAQDIESGKYTVLLKSGSENYPIQSYSKVVNENSPIYVDYPLQICDGNPSSCSPEDGKLMICNQNLPSGQSVDHAYVVLSDQYFPTASTWTTASIFLRPNDSDGPLATNEKSSQGTTEIGTLKPDIVAPGTDARSSKASGHYENDYVGSCTVDNLIQMSGSSMATPAISGSLALIEQYFADGWYPTLTPTDSQKFNYISASLLRAAIINSCKPIGNRLVPNYNEGFGMPSVAAGLGFGDRGVRFLSNVPINNGAHKSYKVTTTSDAEFSVTMSYTDFPYGTENYYILCADLDLIVRAPDGKVYHGNNVNNEFTSTNEKVSITHAHRGEYTIDIIFNRDSMHANDLSTVFFSLSVLGGFSQTDFSTNPASLTEISATCINNCNGGTCNNGICECDKTHTGAYCQIEYNTINYDTRYDITLRPRKPYYFMFENQYKGKGDIAKYPSLDFPETESKIRVCFGDKGNTFYGSTMGCMTKFEKGNNATVSNNDLETVYGMIYPIYDIQIKTFFTLKFYGEIHKKDTNFPFWAVVLIVVFVVIIAIVGMWYFWKRLLPRWTGRKASSSSSSSSSYTIVESESEHKSRRKSTSRRKSGAHHRRSDTHHREEEQEQEQENNNAQESQNTSS